MKPLHKAAATLLVAALALMPTTMWAWQSFPIEKIRRSVVELVFPDMGGARCTASYLGQDYFVTAGHCADSPMTRTIFGKEVQVVEVDEDSDIGILRTTEAIHLPVLEIGPRPKPGDWVLTLGYLAGRQQMTFHPGMVQNPSDTQYQRMIIAGHSGPGMSGGAVVDSQGRIVSIHQCRLDPPEIGQNNMTCAADYYSFVATIKRFVK